MLIQGVSIIISLVLNWYLANNLGPSDYGIFVYAFSWVYLFGMFSMLGLDSVLQREIVKYTPDKIKSLVAFSRTVTLISSIVIMLLFALIVYLLSPEFENDLLRPLLTTIVCLPLFAQLLVNKSICLAYKKIEFSLFPEQVIRPAITLGLIVIFWTFIENPSLKSAILLSIVGIVIAFLSSFLFTARLKERNIVKESTSIKDWIKLGLTFFLLTATVTINSRADILMLGFFGYTEKVGIYNIAVKFSTFIALPLFMANRILSPYISQYFTSKKQELVTVIQKIIRIIFTLGIIGFVIFIIAGESFLNYFGEEFQTAYFALLLLSGGQLINLFVGPVGTALRMSDFEKLALKSMIISTLINIVLNLVLIPLYEMNGAAIATFSSLIFWNIYQYILVRRKLKMKFSVI